VEREAALARTFGCFSPEEAGEMERVIEEGASRSMSMAGSVLVDTNVVVAYFRGDGVLHPHCAGTTRGACPGWRSANFNLAPKWPGGGAVEEGFWAFAQNLRFQKITAYIPITCNPVWAARPKATRGRPHRQAAWGTHTLGFRGFLRACRAIMPVAPRLKTLAW